MQNDESKFKKEFKKRLYSFTLKLIEFLDRLPKDSVLKKNRGRLPIFSASSTLKGKKQFWILICDFDILFLHFTIYWKLSGV